MDLAKNGHIATVQVSWLACREAQLTPVRGSVVSDDARVLSGVLAPLIAQANPAARHESEQSSSVSVLD